MIRQENQLAEFHFNSNQSQLISKLIARAIKTKLQLQNISLDELAASMITSTQEVLNWISGDYKFSENLIQQLELVLNTDLLPKIQFRNNDNQVSYCLKTFQRQSKNYDRIFNRILGRLEATN